jgi:hypothetical protein
MCLAGATYAIIIVVSVVATTTGPDPTVPVAAEAARMAAESEEFHWGSVLGVLAALAFGAFGVAAARLADARGRSLLAALTGASGQLTAAGLLVSFSALAAAAVSADAGFAPEVTVAMAHLHTTSFIGAFAPAGVTVLLACASGVFGRIATAAGGVVGLGCLVATGALLSPVLDRGPVTLAVAVAFFGLPLWMLAVAATGILRRRRTAPDA